MYRIAELTPELMQKYRFFLNYTQEEMAEELGVNRVTYSRWESNSYPPESNKMLTLAFETLVNRKLFAESRKEQISYFEESSKRINEALRDVANLQQKRVRKQIFEKI